MPVAGEAIVSDSVDPLSGLSGPSLFPRTIRDAAAVPVPDNFKDLDSIHNFMKSLKELRSPQELMNEAKKIVDGGAELLESNFASRVEKLSTTNAIDVKGKDRPQERRPGLGLARKREFSLKTSNSQPSVNLEPTLDIDQFPDPDDYYDAYERNENAKKEIQKQLGGSMENISLYKPSNNERRRRPGILGKSYNYKHRYSSTPAEHDDMWMSTQETVSQDIPSAPKDEPQEKLVHPDPNPDADLEEVEWAASAKKTEGKINDILKDLLSCNNEDLEGYGALNLLQERLNIKPLDLENLYMTELPDVGRSNISTASESWQKPRKSSVVIDSALKNLSRKRHMEQELVVANPISPTSSPTPPRSPFASLSLLKKKILQPNPLRDQFSPLNVDISAHPNASPGLPKDKLLGQIDALKDLSMSSGLGSPVEVGNTEPPNVNMDAQEVIGNADSLPEQFVDENGTTKRRDADTRPDASPVQPNDKLLGQVDALKDLCMSGQLESHVDVGIAEPTISNMDAQIVVENADSLPEQSVDENASIRSTNEDSRPNEESDNNIGKTMRVHETDESNPSVLEEEARDDTSSRRQADPEQSPEAHAAKLLKRKRVLGEKRIRNAHPMRKSLADAGTSFETGVRRSKRIRMRPLEYWKGERFLYGRVDDSFKLIGVKYISPGKDNANLKVKSYIPSETPEYKELLDLVARH